MGGVYHKLTSHLAYRGHSKKRKETKSVVLNMKKKTYLEAEAKSMAGRYKMIRSYQSNSHTGRTAPGGNQENVIGYSLLNKTILWKDKERSRIRAE